VTLGAEDFEWKFPLRLRECAGCAPRGQPRRSNKTGFSFFTCGDGAHLPLIDRKRPRHSSKGAFRLFSLGASFWWNGVCVKCARGLCGLKVYRQCVGVECDTGCLLGSCKALVLFCQRHHAHGLFAKLDCAENECELSKVNETGMSLLQP
jgi:hypothetical protein